MKVGSENFCSHFIIIIMYLLCLPDQRASLPFPRSSFSLSFSPLPLIFSYLFAFHVTQWRRQRAVLILFRPDNEPVNRSIDLSICLSLSSWVIQRAQGPKNWIVVGVVLDLCAAATGRQLYKRIAWLINWYCDYLGGERARTTDRLKHILGITKQKEVAVQKV